METIKSCSKWVLVGEHAVISGYRAIVFPLLTKTMCLNWEQSDRDVFKSSDHPALAEVFKQALLKGIEIVGTPPPEHLGNFIISSKVPIGGGLGSSSALCVLIAKWFINRGYIKSSEIVQFATQLEDFFHSKSSGMDIAVVIREQPILFSLTEVEPININWKPELYLSYSGLYSSTADAVKQVMDINNDQINQTMGKATEICLEALMGESTEQQLKLLADGINLAEKCFDDWGLIPDTLRKRMDSLISSGAIAVKPTGSGGGGFILSLWDRSPPSYLKRVLIPVF